MIFRNLFRVFLFLFHLFYSVVIFTLVTIVVSSSCPFRRSPKLRFLDAEEPLWRSSGPLAPPARPSCRSRNGVSVKTVFERNQEQGGRYIIRYKLDRFGGGSSFVSFVLLFEIYLEESHP